MREFGSPAIARAFAATWLSQVPREIVRRLYDLSNMVTLKDKDVAYAAGVEQTSLWAVASGEVRVHVALNEMEPTLGHIHRAGAWFGESEPLLGMPGLVEMRAAGETSVIRVPYARFRDLASEHPELWEALARLTAMNQVLAMSAANDLALPTGRERLAAALLRLAGRRGVLQETATTDVVSVTQQEVAGLANLSLSKVSAHLGSLAQEGLIQLSYGQIRILEAASFASVIRHIKRE